MSGHDIYYELNVHAFLKLEETCIDQGEDGDINTNEDGTWNVLYAVAAAVGTTDYYYYYYYHHHHYYCDTVSGSAENMLIYSAGHTKIQ